MPDTKVEASAFITIGGGCAANAAVAIARLGGKVELWSRVGDDVAGQAIRTGLRHEKVDVRHVEAFEDARSSTSAIIVDAHGERLIVGQRDTSIPSGTSWLPLERLKEAHVVLGDVRWLEGLRVGFARARQEGIPTVLDAELGARETLPDLLRLTDYAIFSAAALRDFAAGASDEARLDHAMSFGPLHAGVTLGAEGYLWRERGGGGRIPSPAVDVVDTTGAGDAFHGAFALALAQGRPIGECARRAAAVAAMKCRRLGGRAGLPTEAELEAFLAKQTA